MKNTHIISALASAAFLAAGILPVYAESTEFVRDDYGLLSRDEQQEIQEYGQQLYDERECGVYLRITDDLGGYSDAADYAEYIYVVEELGYGKDHAGILFLISMGERDYAVTVYGSAYDVFTDPAVDRMIDDVLPYLSDEDWYGFAGRYYRNAERLLENYTYHEIEYDNDDDLIHIDTDPQPEQKNSPNPVFLAISSVFASLAVCLGLRSKNKTTGIKTTAGNYMKDFRLTGKLDLFTHNTVSRVHIPRNNPPSSGGGTTTTYHSSGFHSTSGKF